MNYISKKIADFKYKTSRIYNGSDYHFWFLVVKPYFDSINLSDYVVSGGAYSYVISFPNGGEIIIPKTPTKEGSLSGLLANDEAIMYMYNDVHKTHIDGFLYKNERDSSVTFILNKPYIYGSINLTNINASLCIEASLKGLSIRHLFGKPVSGSDVDFVNFFHAFLTSDYKMHGKWDVVSFIVKTFGSYKVEKNSKGSMLVKAGPFIISEFLIFSEDWNTNKIVSDWVMYRIPSKYKTIVEFI